MRLLDDVKSGTVNVLIYPYWNVNTGKEGTSITVSMVLIYPYWNVNRLGMRSQD